jgi:hypothetical protein
MRGSPWLSHYWEVKHEGGGSSIFNCYDWDVDVARAQLQQLHQSLLAIPKRGLESINDKDEYGHTILHVSIRIACGCNRGLTIHRKIVILIGLLAPIYSDLTDEIDALLMLAERSSVDIDAIAINRK